MQVQFRSSVAQSRRKPLGLTFLGLTEISPSNCPFCLLSGTCDFSCFSSPSHGLKGLPVPRFVVGKLLRKDQAENEVSWPGTEKQPPEPTTAVSRVAEQGVHPLLFIFCYHLAPHKKNSYKGYSGNFQEGNHRKEYANLNLFLMPSLISTECSQHSRGSRRSGICSLFLDSETLLPVMWNGCYGFPNGRTAIELI